MADEPEKPERTTSFAKTLDREALEKASRLKQEFDRAKAPRKRSRERTASDTQPHQPERTTSLAKTAEREVLEPARSVKQEFDRAKVPRKKSRERTTGDSQPPEPERTTSFAKSIDPARALAPQLKEKFDRAKAAADRVREPSGRAAPGRPMTARHDPTATAQPRPTGLEAAMADRKAFNERQAKLARAEEAMQRVAQQKMLDRDRGRGR